MGNKVAIYFECCRKVRGLTEVADASLGIAYL
jgi:hypothetical protein